MTTVGIANLGNRSNKTLREGLIRFMDATSVVAVVEAGDRRAVIEKICEQRDWEPFFGTGVDGAASTPFFWNPKVVEVPHEGTRKSTDATYCGPLGAGPDLVKAKVLNYIRVKPLAEGHFSRDPFVLINLHMPASLYLPCRRRLGKELISDLADMVERREDNVDVIAVGDFNSRPGAKILKPLRQRGMIQRVDFNTKRLRIIDHAWTLNRRAHARPFPWRYSDHRWVLLDVF